MRTNLVQSLKGKQSLFLTRLIALVVMAFTISVQYTYADRYGRAIAYWKDGSPTAAGKVYVSVVNATTTPTDPSDNQYKSYNASGISAQNKGASTSMIFSFYAKANGGYKFTGWYSKSTDETYTLLTTETVYRKTKTTGAAPTGYSDAYTDVICYAEFIKIVYYTFLEPEHGSYTITNNGALVSGYSTIEAEGVVHVKATPADGYRFAGWYSTPDGGVTKNYFSFDSETDLTFTDDATICAQFMLDNGNALFYAVNGDMHDNLTDAITDANSRSPYVVTVAQDGRLASGNYTIPSSVTLLVQSTKSYAVQTTPEVVTATATLVAYRRLTMTDGANITCNGKICVAGKVMSAGGGNKSSYVTGPCGVIDMSSGGHIELNNGAKLYCWGFIKGQDMDQGNNTTGVGTITANSGSEVWEDFAVGDWRGGTATEAINNKKSTWKLFPFQSYSIQNIEVPTTYNYNSKLKNYTDVSGNGGTNGATFTMIDKSNTLFILNDASSSVRKWYDPTTDLSCYELSGTASLNALNISVGGYSVSSSDFYLPISNSMHIIINSGCNLTLSKPMTMQAGSVIEIKNGATVRLESNLFMFDKDDWGKYIHNYYFRSFNNLTNHKSRGAENSNAGIDDAKLIVDGVLNVVSGKGYLYSTTGGADVMGHGGGQVVFGGSLPGSGTIHNVTVGTKEQSYIVDAPNDINSANLHNEDGSYTQTEGSKTYYNVLGRWFVSGKQDGKSDHTYDFTYISSGAVSGRSGTNTTTDAVYSWDKTGLTLRQKWFNVTADACANWWHGQGDQSTWFYNWTENSAWHQFIPTETESVYGSSTNELYRKNGCTWTSLGDVDGDCLYTLEGVKTALVDGHFVALLLNDDEVGWHNAEDETDNYICFSGCNWHSATKFAGEEKAYIVDGNNYIWYNGDWLVVERETPYFFDYDATNVKQYYTYENGAWVLATPCVSVTDVLETRYFYFLSDAFTIANGKKNTTITLLKDVPTITSAVSFTAKNTSCTLDLNGHVIPGTVSSMLTINASGSTFTITDGTEEKEGRIQLTVADNARRYCVNLTSGALILNAGTISAVNTKTYNSSSAKATQSCGLIVKPGMTFTMNGGRVEALATYNPYGIYVEGSTSSGGTITINGGTVHAESTQVSAPYGIYGYGTWNINSGATIEAVAKTTSACALYVEATTNKYFGTLNLNGGTVNATASTKTAQGVYVNCAMVSNKTTPNTFGATYSAVANISGGTFNVSTLSAESATGVTSRGTTTISGGTFYVTPKTTSAYGVSVQHGTTTINGNPVFDVKATTSATGILVATTPADKTGQPMNGNVIVNGGTFDVETTTGDAAYGVYINAAQRVITSTASGYYPGTYYSVGTATINGGTFNVTAKTYNVYGVYVQRLPIYEAGTNHATVHRGSATITGGTFTVRDLTHKTTSGACDGVRSYGTLNITGGIFDVAASAATAKNATYVYGVNVFDGTATISGTPEFTVSAYGTAYGAVANGAIPDKATGLPCEADLTIDGGTFNVNTTTSTTAYGVYAAGLAPRVITSTDAGYYPGTYYSKPVATVNGGTFNVKAKTTTAIGACCGRGVRYDPDVLEPHTVELESFGELNIKGGTFNVSTLGTTTADGVRSFGTTNITGGTFNVTPKTTTATAIRTYAGKTTITDNPHFTVKGTTTVYGLNAGCEAPNAKSGLTYNGEIECNGGTFDLETTTGATCYGVYAYAGSVKITTLHSADANYFAGNYASAGTIVVNDGIFNVKAKTTGAYGVVVSAAVSQSGATGYPTATATAKCDINGGKFLVNGTEKYAVYKKATTANFKISGGYWGGDGVNNNLAYYAVSPNKVLTLRSSHALYPDGYRYTVGQGGTVTWKNGETTLLTEDYLQGETPSYTGETPTKDATSEYTYTHNGWTPDITAMDNSDATYSATYSYTPISYTLTWNLNGGTVTTAGTQASVGATGSPSGSVAFGTGITAPVVEKTDFIFGGWSDGASIVTPASTMPAANTTYTAVWTTAEAGDYLDIVDWKADSLTINANGWTASGWPYTVNNVVYGKDKDAGQAKFRDADRTLTIPYSGAAGSELDITVKSGETVISKHKYTIPFINTVTGAGEDAFVYVSNNTLNIDATSTSQLAVLSIRPDASVNITNGTLAIDSLVLRTEPWQTASISGNFTATKTYYTRIAPNNRTISGPGGDITYVSANYYQFALPLTCTVAVKEIKVSHGAKTTYGKAWLLKSYSESSRAESGAGDNWVSVGENEYIQGKVGYEMSSNSAYYREYLFPVGAVNSAELGTTTDVSYDLGAAGENHAGWNIVGSPLMSVYDNSAANPETGLKVSWLQTDGSYDQGIPDAIYPAVPFTYQASSTQTQISFAETALKASAPRRRVTAAEEPERIQWIHLDVKDANGIGDQTSVLAHPTRYEEAYKTGIDVAKQSLTATRARLYSSHAYGDMAFAGVSDELFEQGVALTLYSPAEQALTFSLRQNDWLNRMEYVWIMDVETGAMIDLLSSDYTAEVTQGTTYGRFYISGRFRAPQIATDIENTQSDNTQAAKARKVLIEQKMYIMVGDKLYDSTGKLVK